MRPEIESCGSNYPKIEATTMLVSRQTPVNTEFGRVVGLDCRWRCATSSLHAYRGILDGIKYFV
jgi:hypothetical protein